MIGTVLRIHWTNLRRDRVAQLMTFIVPVAFFTVFAIIFSGRGGFTARVHVAVVDESHTETSRRLVRGLQREKGLNVLTRVRASARDTTHVPIDRPRAERMVRDVDADLPALLKRVAAAGCVVEDLEIRRPSLHSVFLHLTGRELRE